MIRNAENVQGRGLSHETTFAVGAMPRGAETIRVIVVAGIPFGVVVGVVSRLSMLLLRVTSPPRVIGMRSDDDFVIGRFTVSGTYNLAAGTNPALRKVRSTWTFGVLIRVGWLTIAVAGLAALVTDIGQLP